MTPSEAAGLAAIIRELGSWPPILVFAIIMLAPWVVQFFVSRSMEKRHTEAVQMYKDNVILVEDYAKMVKDYESAIRRWEKVTETVLSVVSLNTQAQTKLLDSIRGNEYCPTMRDKSPNRS